MTSLDDRLVPWTSRVAVYLLFAAVFLRALLLYGLSPDTGPVFLLLLAYLLLLVSENRLAARLAWYPPLYLFVQTALVVALLLAPGNPDFFCVLFMPLSLQAMQRFPPRVAYSCIAGFTGIALVLLVAGLGLVPGLALAALYGALAVFLASYALATLRAGAARAANERLLAELREANAQLAQAAAQDEALAIAQERSRMARELHDSVTQTIFSMTLTTRSALLLLDREPARAARQMARVEELARLALAEMRSLVAGLRPRPAAEQGLVAALREHAATRRLQDNLAVTLHVEGEGGLSPAEERALFRIVQEALNNVAKHAGTARAEVRLHLEPPFWLEIGDEGRGFDPARTAAGRQLGLSTMRERAGEIGWSLAVDSLPGRGTRVRVARPPTGENEAWSMTRDGSQC